MKSRKLRILVIDDDAVVRTAVSLALRAAGYETILAADGGEGLAQYRANPADLIITDLFMPEHEGLEMIVEVRKDFPTVPILAISGGREVSSTMLTVAAQIGATDVLLKPFDSETLVGRVQKLLGFPRAA